MIPYQSVDREAIWAALYQWMVQKVGDQFISIGRKHVAPPDLVAAAQPALFVVQVKETHSPSKPPGAPTRLVLHGFFIVYCAASAVDETIGAETVLAATTLNALFLAIDNAMQPDNMTTGKFTLGGLVEHCWLEGDTDMDPGIFGDQAAAILNIQILVP